MHLTDADLGAALDPGGGGLAGTAARSHAAACTECGQAMQDGRDADREIGDLLCLLDHPHPPIQFSVIEARAARSDTASRDKPRVYRGSAWRVDSRIQKRVAVRWGAILLAAASVAAAAAVPRSPVRTLLAAWAGAHPSSRPRPPVVPPPARYTPIEATAPRAIAITARGSVVLVFRREQAVGAIRVTTSSAPEPSGARVTVVASGDGVTYMVSRDTIAIDNRAVSTLDYAVALPPPSQLPVVSVRVADRVVFARSGATIKTTGSEQPGGSYAIPLTGFDSTAP